MQWSLIPLACTNCSVDSIVMHACRNSTTTPSQIACMIDPSQQANSALKLQESQNCFVQRKMSVCRSEFQSSLIVNSWSSSKGKLPVLISCYFFLPHMCISDKMQLRSGTFDCRDEHADILFLFCSIVNGLNSALTRNPNPWPLPFLSVPAPQSTHLAAF
jgi:hypothetical protein